MSNSSDKKDSGAAAAGDAKKGDGSAATSPPTEATASAMEAIEEDDEFEEFQVAHWGKSEEDAADDTQQWMDNWDADDMDDDFTKNLREELMKNEKK